MVKDSLPLPCPSAEQGPRLCRLKWFWWSRMEAPKNNAPMARNGFLFSRPKQPNKRPCGAFPTGSHRVGTGVFFRLNWDQMVQA